MEVCPVVLPSELLIEILSWLPVKSLIRLKCVCKSWKSLISHDKAFAKLQLGKRSPKNKHIILTAHQPRFSRCFFIPCSLPRLLEEPSIMDQDWCLRFEEFEYNEVIGSCNGLICLLATAYGHRLSFQPCNPATRLRFDNSPALPVVCYTFVRGFGFGYDVSCDTYKVVVVVSECLGHRGYKTMVHCIGDNCWREILSVPDVPIEFRQINGLFVGGCVNWIALAELQQSLIVSLHMRDETYRLLSLPEGTSVMPRAEIQIQVLGNCLCLFHDHKGTHFVAWKMREYGVREFWTRLVSIKYEHLRCDHRFLLYEWLICLCGDEDIFMLSKLEKLGIIYNLSDNSVKHVELLTTKLWFDAKDYVESLVSPC